MTSKTTIAVLTAIVAIGIVTYAGVSTGMETTQTLAPQGVHSVEISGSSLGLRIIGDDASVSDINLETSDVRGCSLTAKTAQTPDGVLTIEFERRRSWGLGWCDPTATLRLPSTMNVTVKMDNVAGEFAGLFDAFSVASEKAVIYFNGGVSSFDLTGEMAAVYLKFDADVPRENVRINVDKLVSNISLMGGWSHATGILREIF
ncbi:hypothetical protein GCM10007094_33060 [Pseudovibrio japonicus]|uniref:Uncharacterized protein n=1 Tax=Pseudovibrio japonicus TaxID=366534 RepID=A0ABQ3EM49_9HYPH|nr:hypothetical protein [Pseudovibrio japonicus]GHB41007.1 hypothetical protein GCM10007094_33060 [Pseudovibrio japonicus]